MNIDVYIIRLNIESPEDGELKAVINSVASTLYYYMHKYFYHHPALGFLSFEPPYEKLKELLDRRNEQLRKMARQHKEIDKMLNAPLSTVYKFKAEPEMAKRLIIELLNAYDSMYDKYITKKDSRARAMVSIARKKMRELLKILETHEENQKPTLDT